MNTLNGYSKSTLTDMYALTAAGGHYPLLPSGYASSNASDLSHYWCRMLTCRVVHTNNDYDITLYVHSAYNNKRGFIHIRARLSTTLYVNLTQISGNLPLTAFRLYYKVSNDNSAEIQLWCDCGARWDVYNYKIISFTTRSSNETSFPGDLYSGYFSETQTLPDWEYIILTQVYTPMSLIPDITNTYNIGSSDNKWNKVYATSFEGNATSATSATKLSSTTVAFTPAETALTPDEVYALVGGTTIKRGTWSYAGNGHISNDTTGVGTIDLAGATVIQADAGSSNQYTQLYLTSSTGSAEGYKPNEIFMYNKNAGYSPSWTRVLTNRNYTDYCLPLAGGTMTGQINSQGIVPTTSNAYSLGSSNLKWRNIYANTINGTTLNGNVADNFIKFSTLENNINSYLYFSPLNQAASNLHSANRLAYAKPTGIKVEYSTDGGTTWVDYELSDTEKISLVTSPYGKLLYAGKQLSTVATANDKLRITFNATDMGLYTQARALLINASTNGSVSTVNGATNDAVLVDIEKANRGSETNFSSWATGIILRGWSGWNSIPLNGVSFGGGITQTSNTGAIRLTFYSDGAGSSYTSGAHFGIYNFYLIGSTFWAAPSNMSTTGHLYDYDVNQSMILPKDLIPQTHNVGQIGWRNKQWAAICANYFYENGTPLSEKYLGKTAQAASSVISEYAKALVVTSAIGGTNTPVYINASGVPIACSYDVDSVKTTASSTNFYIAGSSSSSTTTGTLYKSANVKVQNGTAVYASGGFYESSDARLKNFGNNINIDLDKLVKIPKKYFTWKDDKNVTLQIGTSAQAVKELYPELVGEDENGVLSVAYDKLAIIALAAVDKLYELVKSLQANGQGN